MFIGHYAPAFVAAAHVRRPGHGWALGGLFIAAQLVDYAFMALLLADVEQMRIVPRITAVSPLDLYHMPYTHSLLATLAWAAAFAIIAVIAFHKARFAAMVALVITSHWVLDLLVHRPDLTLLGQGPKFGLGLWNVPWVEMPLEILITLGGMFYYLVRTRQRRGKSDHALYTLLGVLLLVQLVNWFGPEPTGVTSFAWMGLIVFSVLVALAAWLGSTREYWRETPIEPGKVV